MKNIDFAETGEACTDVLCNLTVEAAMRCSEMIGIAHGLYYYRDEIEESRVRMKLEDIRAALNKLTGAVVAAEQFFNKPKLLKRGERFTTGTQPCGDFLRGDADIAALGEGNRRNLHQCPVCEGNRAWCDNCHSDHHDGGWGTCKPGVYADPPDED